MTAPIRSMPELVEALKMAQVERGISHATLCALSGLADGYVSKLFAHKPMKNLGYQSTGEILGALGKAIVLVDDETQIALVSGRWKKRHVRGGAAMQMRQLAAPSIPIEIQEPPVNIEEIVKAALSERIKEMRKTDSSAKRQARREKQRARQRKAAHAARKRWGIQS